MRRVLFILALFLCGPLYGQELTVLPRTGGGGLAVGIDYLWRYNLYEHSRWGLGLSYTAEPWRIVANAGYGLHDHQLKWGVGGRVGVDSCRNGNLYLMAMREYATVGNRYFGGASLADLGGLASFMSLRMSDQLSAIAGYSWSTKAIGGTVDLRIFHGGRLFNNDGLLYRKEGDTIATENGLELRIYLTCGAIKANLLLGRTWPAHKPIAQLLVEDNNNIHFSPFILYLHFQAGITPPNTPYIYMFDLGGTLGSPLYFRNSLLTVAPCQYTANTFILAAPRIGFEEPLFTLTNQLLALGTAPRPFIGLSGVWGRMWGQDEDGRMTYEGLDLQAPSHTVVEAVAGVDGLLRWGLVDYGCALACGFLPAGSQPRWAFMLTAALQQ